MVEEDLEEESSLPTTGNNRVPEDETLFIGSPTLGSRLGEFAFGILVLVVAVLAVFPPSGLYFYPWLFAPACGVIAIHFLRRTFDSRPRLIVHRDGIVDRTSVLGGTLEIRWEEIREISKSSWSNTVEIEVMDLANVRARATWIQRLWMRVNALFGKRTVSVSPFLLGIGKNELTACLEEARFSSELSRLKEARDFTATSRISGEL